MVMLIFFSDDYFTVSSGMNNLFTSLPFPLEWAIYPKRSGVTIDLYSGLLTVTSDAYATSTTVSANSQQYPIYGEATVTITN
jgi:hypothetical protein